MDTTLQPIKEECLKLLRAKHFPEINKSCIKIDTGQQVSEILGAGAFATVYRVRIINTGDRQSESLQSFVDLEGDIGVKFAAVKAPNSHGIYSYLLSLVSTGTSQGKNRRILKYYERECAIWATISSRENARDHNLLEFYGFLESFECNMLPTFVCKVYELGDVRKYMKKGTRPPLTAKQKLFLISDIANALAFMHGVCGVVHRDVKGANILLEEREHRLSGILGDFGSAKEFMQSTPWLISSSSESGNDRWSPPEYSHEGGFHNDRGPGDIWSLGCTMLELLQEADPWYQIPDGEIPDRVANHEYPPKRDNVPQEHYEVMKKCWKRAYERPSAAEMQVEITQLAESFNS